MRTDPDQLENVRVSLAVHEHQIGPQMAVDLLLLHGMIHVAGRQRHMGGEQFQGFEQGCVEMPAIHAALRKPEVAPELGGGLDCSR